MAITNSSAAKAAATNAIVDLLDVGTGTAKLRLKTSGGTTLADLSLSNPAFGNADTNGLATANTITSATAVGTGTAALFDALDRNGAVVFSGTVAASGADLTIDDPAITTGDSVSCSAWAHDAIGGD